MLHIWCHLCQNMAEHLLWYMFNERHMMDVIGLNCTVWTAGGSKIFKLKSTGRHIALINLKEKKRVQFWNIWDLLLWPDSMLVFKVVVAMTCVLHERHHKKMERRILERNQRRRDKEIEPNERDLSRLSGLMSLVFFQNKPMLQATL